MILKIKIYKLLFYLWFNMVVKLVYQPKGEHRLRLFENDLPRRIFGTKRVEETG
jgi:hypothetical protein